MVNLEDLKNEARILKDGKVKYVIGYARSTADGKEAAPAFIKEPEDVDKLIWDPTCVHNLTKFLVDEKRNAKPDQKTGHPPIGIVVKGCDSRAINVLFQEKYIDRDDVYLSVYPARTRVS